MLFSNVFFILYFLPLALVVYHLCFFSRRVQNCVALCLSLASYAAGQSLYIFILIFFIIWTWSIGLAIQKTRKSRPHLAAATGVIINVAVLLMFKQFKALYGLASDPNAIVSFLKLSLPLGLSYYALQSIGYFIDLDGGLCEAENNILNIALFLSFFPKQPAGPLISWREMRVQISQREFSLKRISGGLIEFSVGFIKVNLVGRYMTRISDIVFASSAIGHPEAAVPVTLAWVGLLALFLKYYYDFSGYCEMARGLAMMFGFELPANFNYPYSAKCLSDFWKNWNITVLGWFRRYVYPLFQKLTNKVGDTDIVIINICLTWILFGLWHDASWATALWGFMQFLFLIIEHFLGYFGLAKDKWYMRLYMWFTLIISFVFLRTESHYLAATYLRNLAGYSGNGFYSAEALVFIREYWLWFLVGIAGCFPIMKTIKKRFTLPAVGKFPAIARNVIYPAGMLILLCLVFIYMSQDMAIPFSYY
jgi:D-alanyl-lipoteichoic acid acyltransferase DltB (MBOAT superfamily)